MDDRRAASRRIGMSVRSAPDKPLVLTSEMAASVKSMVSRDLGKTARTSDAGAQSTLEKKAPNSEPVDSMHGGKLIETKKPKSKRVPPAPPKKIIDQFPGLHEKTLTDSKECELIYARIFWVDNGIVSNSEENQAKADHILHYAFELVKSIGHKYVVALYLHYNTTVELDRYNVSRLRHYSIIVEATAKAATLPVDFGECAVYVEAGDPQIEPSDGFARMKTRAYRPGVYDLQVTHDTDLTRTGYVDESLLDPMDDLPHYYRPPATLAYNGFISVGNTFAESDSVIGSGIHVRNHSFEAVIRLQTELEKNPEMTVHELYRLNAYQHCFEQGPAAALAMAAVTADNLKQAIEVFAIPFEPKKDSRVPLEMILAKPSAYAPLSFIIPVDNKLHNRKNVLFQVFCGMFGNYSFALPPSTAASLIPEKEIIGESFYGFPYLHSPFGGSVVLRPVETPKVFNAPWERARYEQLQEPLKAHAISALLQLEPSHPGYPASGAYLGDLLATGATDGTPNLRVVGGTNSAITVARKPILEATHVSLGHVQPHQHARTYLSVLNPPNVAGVAAYHVFASELYPVNALYRAERMNALAIYTGGLNPSNIGWRTLISTKVYSDVIRVPIANKQVVLGIHTLAHDYNMHCRQNQKTTFAMTRSISNGSTLQNAKSAQGDYWNELTGGAVQYNHETLWIDSAWAHYVHDHFKPKNKRK